MIGIYVCRAINLDLRYGNEIPLEDLGLLISFILVIILVSRYVFKVKLEKNLYSEEELKSKPLYKQRDLLLQEKPLEYHRPGELDEFPMLTQPSWLLRIFVLIVIIGFFAIPLSTIWHRGFYWY